MAATKKAAPRVFSPDKLRDTREAKGMTQRQMGDVIGTVERTYWRIENGQVTPDGNQISKLASALGVSIEDLFE